ADDARGVTVNRRDDRGVQLKQRDEFLRMLRHPAPDDEQVRTEEELDVAVERLKSGRPVLPAETFTLHSGVRRPPLDGIALVVEMTELGVGQQHAVIEEGRPDAGAES